MAVMAWLFMAENMVDQYVYWKIGKIVDHLSKIYIDYCNKQKVMVKTN